MANHPTGSTRGDPTDPPTPPSDLPAAGGVYPYWGAKVDRVLALGPCAQCGLVHARCKGHAKKWAGAPCTQPAAKGQLICRFHGGAAPQNIKAAVKRMATEAALDEAGALIAEARLVVEGQSGAEQLVDAINQAGAMAMSYRWLLGQLPAESKWSWIERLGGDGAPTRWVEVAEAGMLGPNARGELQLHAYEEGHRYWTALHGRLLVEAAKLGLDERRQMFAEEQVNRIGDAVVALVAGLGLELDDPAVVPVVEAFLRQVSGEPAAVPAAAIEATAAEAPDVLWSELE